MSANHPTHCLGSVLLGAQYVPVAFPRLLSLHSRHKLELSPDSKGFDPIILLLIFYYEETPQRTEDIL